MKLWILKAREDLPATDDPWITQYGTNKSVLVRASTEHMAREFAHGKRGDERVNRNAWIDSKYSTCEEITVDGIPGVLLIDHHEA